MNPIALADVIDLGEDLYPSSLLSKDLVSKFYLFLFIITAIILVVKLFGYYINRVSYNKNNFEKHIFSSLFIIAIAFLIAVLVSKVFYGFLDTNLFPKLF
jgi:purine-cytosine permease-like protein